MDEQKIQCVGFIMDGNRRWAKAQGLPKLEGHAKGYKTMCQMISAVRKEGISHVIFYAFSTENWKRTEEEVGYLMKLLERGIVEIGENLKRENSKTNLRIVGQIERLPANLQKEIANIESRNITEPEFTVWVAISYGGRAEIVDAVNRAVEAGEKMTEESFGKLMWTNGMPDPDFIIRTSGEYRLSNFLLWQSAYSELFFTDTLWPDFGETEFQSILNEYATRQRRRGA